MKVRVSLRLNEKAHKIIKAVRKMHGFVSDGAAVEYLAAVWADNKNQSKTDSHNSKSV